MSDLVVYLGAAVAVGAAIRSTWSPCGLSMLSTITPFAERSRGHRYSVTSAWFVVGAVVGGATLGALAALAAELVGVAHPSTTVLAAAACAAAVVCAAGDVGLLGVRFPVFRRQVNERWLDNYRGWFYGAGFGWQIGVGIATYIMTAGVFLLFALAALTASPWKAFLLWVGFGFVRGLAVLSTARLTTPASMRTFHARFAAAAPWSRAGAIAVQLAVAVAAAVAIGPALGLGLFGIIAVAGVSALAGRRRSAHSGAA